MADENAYLLKQLEGGNNESAEVRIAVKFRRHRHPPYPALPQVRTSCSTEVNLFEPTME